MPAGHRASDRARSRKRLVVLDVSNRLEQQVDDMVIIAGVKECVSLPAILHEPQGAQEGQLMGHGRLG